MPQWAVIGVPIDSVGRAGGTEHAPAAFRDHGLVARVGGRDGGDLEVAIRGEARDPATGVVGIAGVLATTTAVRSAVREAVTAGRRPLLLGGCCALVPGALAGLRDAVGALGVAYVDGHVDVYDGHSSPTGEAADMPMGVAFGLGPESWVQAAGGPSAEPADVDVLDQAAMPATDYLMPGGLGWEEVTALLRPLCASPALAGLSLGCVNPEKDPDGTYIERTCALFERIA